MPEARAGTVRWRAVPALFAGLLACATAPTESAPAPPLASPQTTADVAAESPLLSEINLRRRTYFRRPLVADPRLSAVAVAWADRMAETGIFTHGNFSSRIGAAFPGRATGEVIAWGQTTPEQVVSEWMDSPGHRRIILGPYLLVGHGRASRPGGRPYWVCDLVR